MTTALPELRPYMAWIADPSDHALVAHPHMAVGPTAAARMHILKHYPRVFDRFVEVDADPMTLHVAVATADGSAIHVEQVTVEIR
jgi:hypothetical protein